MQKRITVYKYRLIFYKKDELVYISHLDVMTLFRRAVRRTDLPFVLTGGFTPRVKLSVTQALKLGKSSEAEEMLLWLLEKKEGTEIIRKINDKLPAGVGFTKADFLNESII